MSLLTTLILTGFSSVAHAGSPYINPVSLTDFQEWNLVDKTGSVGSISMEGPVEVPLYADKMGTPTLKTFVTTDKTEEGERGDLFELLPETSLIVVSEAFAKANELNINVTNKRLIPVPDDFKVGGEIKYVTIPSLNVGGMVLNDVTALISGSENKLTSGLTYPHMVIGLGALPTSYAVLHSKGIIKFSDDGAGLMKEVGATGVPYQSQTTMVGTIGKKTISGANKTLLTADQLIVDVDFNGQTVPTALEFYGDRSTLDSYVDTKSDIFKHSYDTRLDWLTPKIGDVELHSTFVGRQVLQPYSDALMPVARIGHGVLLGYDIVVDKTSQTVGMVEHEGFEFSNYYTIHLEEARKALEPKESSEETDESGEDNTEEAEESLNVAGINGLISALETGGAFSEALEQYELLIADNDEKTDCQLWLNYGHANRKLGNVDAAQKAYTESARLYHSWWDIELGRRMDINKAQEGMDEEETEAAKAKSEGADLNSVEDGWYISQPEACYRADGWVAFTDLLSDNHDAIEKNYRDNLDLDARLAQAFGHSALSQGKTELAHEAYRQAVKLENGWQERSANRVNLALVYADQGKWDQASELFQESLELNDSALNAILWFDNAVAQSDADSALKMIQNWAAGHPNKASAIIVELRHHQQTLTSLQTELAELQPNAEDTDEAAEVSPENAERITELTAQIETTNQHLTTASNAFAAWTAHADRWYASNQQYAKAMKVLGYTYSGQLDKAGAELDAVKGKVGLISSLSFAAANYYAVAGKTEEANQALKQATILAPYAAGLAMTLGQ